MAITSTREKRAQSRVQSGSSRRVPSTWSFRSITEGISIEERVWRKISRAICLVGGISAPPPVLLRFENIRIQYVRRTLALEHGNNVVGGHHGHFGARLERSGGNVRGQHNIGAVQSGMEERLVLKHIQGRARDFLVFESGDESGFVDNRPARGVDDKCRRLHA